MEWNECDCEEIDEKFRVSRVFMPWSKFWGRNREKQTYQNYSAKNNFKNCLIAAGISYLHENCFEHGYVDNLDEEVNEYGNKIRF